eukprot:GHRR01015442.1.p1 GENE.GHRR01015442.1~~GHRR01015442.1.p1  ORF type:complete len:485 (+),score=158.22 GHRR01015442.1:518-1972(+)
MAVWHWVWLLIGLRVQLVWTMGSLKLWCIGEHSEQRKQCNWHVPVNFQCMTAGQLECYGHHSCLLQKKFVHAFVALRCKPAIHAVLQQPQSMCCRASLPWHAWMSFSAMVYLSCRTTIVDDARGVGEPLNETLCGCTACGCVAGGLPARGRHMLVVGPATGAARHLRLAQQLLNDPLLLTFAKLPAVQPSPSSSHAATAVSPTAASNHGVASSSANRNSGSGSMGGNTGDMVNKLGLQGTWSGLSGQAAANGAKVVGLPKNVHLVTLMRAHDSDPTRLIIRLAHTFQMGEDNELSFPVHVNLSQLLAFSISNITELSLTAARYKVGMQQRRNWTAGSIISGDNSRAHNGVQRGRKAAAAGNASQQGSHDEFSGQNSMHGWGDAFMPELAAASSCQAKQQRNSQGNDASAFADTQQRMHRVVVQAQHADEKQRHDPMQAWQQHKLQHTAVSAVAVYDIWAHHGDRLPVVELYPMEIRTWELIIDV